MEGGGELDDADGFDVLVGGDFGEGGGWGEGVEVEDADGVAAGGGAADGHLGDVDAVIAEDGADGADDAGHVVVREDEQVAVEIGFEAEIAEADEAGHVVAEERAAGDEFFCWPLVTSTDIEELKAPGSLRDSSVSLMPRSRRSSSALTMLTSSSRARSSRPAQKAAVTSRVFFLVSSPR